MARLTLDQFATEATTLCEQNMRRMRELLDRAEKSGLDAEITTMIVNLASMRAATRLSEMQGDAEQPRPN